MKEFLKTPKGSKVLKLLIWLAIILILFIYAIINNKVSHKGSKEVVDNKQIMTTEDVTPSEVLVQINKVKKKNYNFKFIHIIDNVKTIISGSVLDDKCVYYIKTDTGISEYYLDNNGLFKVFNDEINLTNEAVYLDNYYNLEYLMEKIENNFSVDDKYLEFKKNDIYGNIYVNDEDSLIVEINVNNEKYILNYSNINKLTSIQY